MKGPSASPVPDSPWTIAVLGPGGVGGLLAALLSRAGHRVIVLAGDDTVQTLRHNGIEVRSGQFGHFTARVQADVELREPVDACFIAVKHTSLRAALERFPPAFADDTLIVPLLNGTEHPDALRSRYGAHRVAGGVIRVESTRTAPGVIEHGSPFMEIDLPAKPARADALAAVLDGAGVQTRLVEGEQASLWAKLAFLAPWALLSTHHRVPIGALRTDHRAELEALVTEVATVAGACGATTSPGKALALYDAFPADSKSSMQRDAEAGRPLELDAIAGAVLRAGDRHDIPVPITARLSATLGLGAG
ncbi:ketopantoate reductase family protein [Streptomyces sp. BRA346]|uniref:ketopantoate reductase family protein n=1 Tax=Streptomyces sp. BRA346 TaxID=2878199 RepID=UPI004062A5F4